MDDDKTGWTTASTDSPRSALESRCTLEGGELKDRIAWLRRTLMPRVVASERLQDGIALEFYATPQVSRDLDRLIHLEGECCHDLRFERLEGQASGRSRLEIHGLDADDALVRSLLKEGSPRRFAIGARLGWSGGAAVLASLLVCWSWPIIAVVLFSGAAAADPGPVGEPLAIGVAAIAAALIVWRWRSARQRKPAA